MTQHAGAQPRERGSPKSPQAPPAARKPANPAGEILGNAEPGYPPHNAAMDSFGWRSYALTVEMLVPDFND